jgi:CxxC-x17-CxxC domain-containing protein
MGDYNREGRSGGRSRDFSRGRDDRSSSGGGYGERRRPEMHDAVCDKCGKDCQVPFRPSGDKPVLCSDCFKRADNGGSRFGPRSSSSSSFSPRASSAPAGISKEQFSELNTKLDKILEILNQLEFEDEDSEEGEEAPAEEVPEEEQQE